MRSPLTDHEKTLIRRAATDGSQREQLYATLRLLYPDIVESSTAVTGVRKDDVLFTRNDMHRFTLGVLTTITDPKKIDEAMQ